MSVTIEDAPIVARVPLRVRWADERDAAQMGAYALPSDDGVYAVARRQSLLAFAGIHGLEWARLFEERLSLEVAQ